MIDKRLTFSIRGDLILGLTLGLSLLTACANPPKVVQGQVVSHDDTSKTVTVRDDAPPRTVLSFNVATAEIGAAPHPGDQLRIAFRTKDGVNVASRVMNITRQTELKGIGGGH